MSEQIDIDLSISSINDAIKKLRAYKLKMIRRNRSLVYHLMETGWQAAKSVMSTAASEDSNPKITHYNDIPNTNYRGSVVEGKFILSGEDIIFWEFGAGIHYNGHLGSSPHPKAAQYGGELDINPNIGMYSDSGNGYSLGQYDEWSFGHGQKTHGTEAAMPMYNAWKHMYEKVPSLATKIFTQDNLYSG